MQPGPSSSALPTFATQDVPGSILKALAQAGLTPERAEAGQLADRVSALETPALLLWDIPSGAVAAALHAGDDPAEVVMDWLDRHRELLALLRHHRRRLRLIDARLFSSFATAEDRGRALSALGLDDAVTVAPDGHANGEEMGRSLAQLALPRVDLLRSCLDELEASSVTLRTDALTMPWFASTAAAFGQIRQLHQNASELARVRQDLAAEQDIGRRQVAEITLLRDQLGLQQSETQGALVQTADQQQQEVGILKQLALKAEQEARDARKALRAFQDDAEAERKRLSAENDRLQEQLTRHQAELQQALADRSDKADDPASGPEPDGNIAALHGELGLLRGQMGLQLTETARQEQDALRRQELRNKAAYESERALARALTDLRTEAEERKAFQDRLQETEANRLALEEERNILSQKLNEVLSSRSWRITRPLRQARLTVAPIPDDQ